MSQQSNYAAEIADRLDDGPVPVADLVTEVRSLWGDDPSTGAVHRFICEAVYCLLSAKEEVRLTRKIDGSYLLLASDREDEFLQFEEELLDAAFDHTDADRYVLVSAEWP
jgi:hypothetical protein